MKETENLLGKPVDDECDDVRIPGPEPPGSKIRTLRAACDNRNTIAIWAHIILFTLNILLFLYTWNKFAGNQIANSSFNQNIEEHITYESLVWDFEAVYMSNGSINPAHQTAYIGPPTTESEAAWEDLLRYQDVVLHDEDLGEFRDTEGLAWLADGSGVFSTLSVYHGLHCIRQVHHFLHFEHYYPLATTEDRKHTWQHAEHCLDILRQYIQCHPDLTAFPMRWGKRTRIPIGLDLGHHKCVNFKSVQEWMSKRSFDPFERGVLTHPTFDLSSCGLTRRYLGYPYKFGGSEVGTVVDELLSDLDDENF